MKYFMKSSCSTVLLHITKFLIFLSFGVLSISVIAETKLYFVHSDHLGAPKMVTNNIQNVAWAAQTLPFGVSEEIASNIDQFNQFPGQYLDTESGTHYNYFRDYDPTLGRYIQSDPIGLAGGLNTYNYVEANPLSEIDYYGLRPCTTQEAEQFGLDKSNCWIGTDDISGKCTTAECAAKVLPVPKRSNRHGCYALCIGAGQAEGMALERFMEKKAENYNEKVCEDINARIKENKIANKAGKWGKVLGIATTAQCINMCNAATFKDEKG